MISILVVDDNPLKLQKINRVLTDIDGISEKNITVVPDSISAKISLSKQSFDILLLDIQLPNRIDQVAKADGGLILLRELRASKRFNLPSHIIGITAHDDSFEEVTKEFSEQLLSLVKYQETSDEWSNKLKKHIDLIITAKNNSPNSIQKSYDYDIAVICALDKVELESIKRLSENWNLIEKKNDNTVYYSCTLKNGDRDIRIVAASSNQMGMPAAAVLSMKLIHNFTPQYLVMTGICAGIKSNNVSIGDILISEPSWDYGSGKIKDINGEPVFFPDPLQIRLNADLQSKLSIASSDTILLEKIKNSWPGDKPDSSLKVHIGPFASGASVLAHVSVVESILRHNRKLIGIDMETYGVLYAATNCSKPRPIPLSLKSVCDFADEDKNDKFQRYAAYTSSQFLYNLISKYLDFDLD